MEMEADGGGDFELRINYGDALGPRRQNPEAIKIGAFEAGQICAGYYPNKFPLLSVGELPFLFPRDMHQRSRVEIALLYHPEIVKEMKNRWKMKFFGPAFLPAYEFMGNRRIGSTADMKGVKMRISGLNGKALQAFGGVPTMVTAPEGYQALDRGTIDMFGFPYSYAFGAYKLFEVSKYVTDGVGMGGFQCFQGVSTDAYNRLPQQLKDNMPRYQQAAIDSMLAAYTKADKKWIPIFKKRLEVVPFPPAERAKLAAGAEEIWEEWVQKQEAKGRPGRKVLEFVKAQVAKYTR